MSLKFRFIELNYYYHGEFNNAGEVIRKHQPSNLFAPLMASKATVTLIKHLNYTGSIESNGIQYRFFKSSNRFTHIPFPTHRFIKNERPDMVLVQGLIFPLQVIALRMKIGTGCKIVLQHQGEPPFRRKKLLQKIADRYVDGYLFTSLGNAREWLEAGVINDKSKCFEIIPSSTQFTKLEKQQCKQKLGLEAPVNFLWVGRLNANKDPIAVLKGFEQYFNKNTGSKLYMIYSEADLLPEIKNLISGSSSLHDRVILTGSIPHEQLQDWYSAADYFVSGSHREGGSYALTEAMACGCIPIVTSIPSAMKVIENGQAGYYYEAGKSNELYDLLSGLDHTGINEMSAKVQSHFNSNFSPLAIAERLVDVYEELKSK